MSEGPFKPIILPIIKDVAPMSLFDSMTDEDWKKVREDNRRLLADTINLIRESYPNALADELANVQSMDGNVVQGLLDNAKSEEELIREGYKPVCPHTRLMWIKSDDEK
jgi:hypothetical protein